MNKSRTITAPVFGGMLLVAGSCIGAGMLGLPILTGLSGFFPSLLMLLIGWAFMTFTGLLLVEVNGWFEKRVNLVTMAGESFGKKGRLIAWLSYICLFYSLLVAYTAVSGKVFAAILESIFHWNISAAGASIFFTVLFGYIIYLGTRTVDLFNRVLMVGLIVTYLGMIGLGLMKIDPDLLEFMNPGYVLYSLPVLVVSFGFQNMIPSLTAYLKEDLKKVKITIIGGSIITLMVYLVWQFLILGTIDPAMIHQSYLAGEEATIPLKRVLGFTSVTHFSQGFAFFAIVTSFLAQGLTLTHFIADGLKVEPNKKNLIWLCALSLGPPLFLALYNPQIFFQAISVAGGIFAMILFGLLPIGMAWVGRYKRKHPSKYHAPGGKIALQIGFVFATLVIICEIVKFF